MYRLLLKDGTPGLACQNRESDLDTFKSNESFDAPIPDQDCGQLPTLRKRQVDIPDPHNILARSLSPSNPPAKLLDNEI